MKANGVEYHLLVGLGMGFMSGSAVTLCLLMFSLGSLPFGVVAFLPMVGYGIWIVTEIRNRSARKQL